MQLFFLVVVCLGLLLLHLTFQKTYMPEQMISARAALTEVIILRRNNHLKVNRNLKRLDKCTEFWLLAVKHSFRQNKWHRHAHRCTGLNNENECSWVMLFIDITESETVSVAALSSNTQIRFKPDQMMLVDIVSFSLTYSHIWSGVLCNNVRFLLSGVIHRPLFQFYREAWCQSEYCGWLYGSLLSHLAIITLIKNSFPLFLRNNIQIKMN